MDDAEWNSYVKKRAIENQRKLSARANPNDINKSKKSKSKRILMEVSNNE